MIWALNNWKLVLILTLAFLIGLVGLRSRWLTRQLEVEQAKARELEGYKRQRRLGDEADKRIGTDAAAARRYLHERNRR